MNMNEIKFQYETAQDFRLYAPKHIVDYWYENCKDTDFEEFAKFAITQMIEIPEIKIEQLNGTIKTKKAWTMGWQLALSALKKTIEEYNEFINTHADEFAWGKFKVQKTSDEDFKSVLHELTYKLTEAEEKMMGFWLWQSINKLRGHFPEMPTFLGLVGKPGDGKDFTLGQFQLALGMGDETGLIPEGYSMNIFDASFQTREFYTQGIVRFEEISARRKADIDTFKTKITNPKVVIEEKYQKPFTMFSRNSYCGTANESFQCMVNDTENRRIIEINWKSVKGEVSKKQVREIFERLIACCPEDEIYDEDEIFGYIHEQFDGDVTTDLIWSCDELQDFLLTTSRIRVGQVKRYLNCSFAQARKFLQDERIFEYVPTGHYYKVDNIELQHLLHPNED